MLFGTGKLNRRCTVMRRAAVTNTRGAARGDYADVSGLTRIACGYRELSLREISLGTAAQGVIDGELTVRISAATRTITTADRIVLEGQGFDVVSPGLPDPDRGVIRIQIKRVRG